MSNSLPLDLFEILSEISQVDDIATLRSMLNKYHYSKYTESRDLINNRISYLKRKQEKEKYVTDVSNLVNGEYYFVYINDKKTSISLSKENTSTPVSKCVPLIAYHHNNELKDIVSGTKVSLNPLDLYTYQFRNVILADYVVKMNKEEMKSSLSILFSLTEDEKSSYGHELVEKYGAFSDRNKEATMRLINRGGN